MQSKLMHNPKCMEQIFKARLSDSSNSLVTFNQDWSRDFPLFPDNSSFYPHHRRDSALSANPIVRIFSMRHMYACVRLYVCVCMCACSVHAMHIWFRVVSAANFGWIMRESLGRANKWFTENSRIVSESPKIVAAVELRHEFPWAHRAAMRGTTPLYLYSLTRHAIESPHIQNLWSDLSSAAPTVSVISDLEITC